MKKIISLILSCCFINLIVSDIYAGIFTIPTSTTMPIINVYSNNFIPIDLGKLTEDIYVAGNNTIINIQDLHADKSTQKNIISILDYLVNNYNVNNIYLEGAIGDLDVSWLNVITNTKLKESVIERFIQDGKITGVEYFALINKNQNIKFKGLEEKNIYKENFDILEKLYTNRDNIIDKIIKILNNLNSQNKIYSYKIKQLNYINDEYKKNNMDINQYYSYLIKFVHNANIDATYKTILKFLELEKSYSNINEKKLKQELIQINSMLKTSLDYKKYVLIQKLQQNYQNKYYEEILSFIVDNKINYKYEEFIKFYNLLQEKNSINAVNLLQEENDILNKLYSYHSKTIQEKNLLFLVDYTNKLLLFLTNNLTAIDYDYVKNNSNKYFILLENYINKVDIMELKQWYKLADKFYSNNEKRNKFFLENIYNSKISKNNFVNDAVVKNNKRKSFEEILKITKQPMDIMITGGYHSQGLKDLMEKLNINYAVIMPNVNLSNINESKNIFYNDYQKQYSIISNTYQKFIRSSMMNEMWPDPTKVIVGTFIDYSLLDELYKNLQDSDNIKGIISDIQKYLVDVFNKKGMNCNFQLSNIEQLDTNSFLITVFENGKYRMFFVSQDIVKEISNKSEIKDLVSSTTQNEQSIIKSKKKVKNKTLGKIKRFFTMVLLMPLTMVVGGGITGRQVESKKELVDNGANINVVNPETIEYIDTVFDNGAMATLEGRIKLNGVYVGKGNKLSLKTGQNTTITMENIDLSDIGNLDITIEDKGDFRIVKEDSVIKIYKILKTDFSSSKKERVELVSVLNKGKLVINSEDNWTQTNDKPIVVFYKERGYSYNWESLDNVKVRSNLIYKDCNVVYVDVSSLSSSFYSSNFELDENKLKTILKENGLSDKNICIDVSLIEDNVVQSIYSSLNLFTQFTNSVTLLYTNIPYRSVFPSKDYKNRENKHFYLNEDGSYIRYPNKDRNWLRSVLEKYMPSFEKQTFIFVWPVESAKHTYKPNLKYGGHPEEQISAFEPFKIFMDKAKEYVSEDKDAVVFMPGYLKSELATYFNDSNILENFIDVTYGGENSDINLYDIRYRGQTAKDIEKIELLKINGLTIVVYPEGNRGHNEQAYLETLMATYNFGKKSLDSMLTQAGFHWKQNTIYVYEGKEIQSLDVKQQLLKNPSIKTGKVTYVFDNLKRAFINLYSNMKNFFSTILPKYTKGNWVSIENKVRNSINIDKIKEALTAKSKLGFDSIMIVPVQQSLLNEMDYGYPTILEQDGTKIPVYSIGDDNGIICLVGVSDDSTKWQQSVLLFIKDSLHDYKNNIVSFNGVPQISSKQATSLLGSSFIPVVINKNREYEETIESLGYDTIVDAEDIASRVENSKLKYPHVAQDMLEISEAIKVIKALKKKSFFGQFEEYKASYVGTKIASDEHIFNSELEENEFVQILKGTDIDFVTVVIRDNDLGAYVLGRETTVKENLIKLSKNLHENNKKIILEYTFRFIDDFFETFTRTIDEDSKDIGIDGIKLDLADCSEEDIEKAKNNLKSIRSILKNKEISVQVSDKVWVKFRDFFGNLNITRTVSSKDKLLLGEDDLSNSTDINYEISMYKNQEEYEERRFRLYLQREKLKNQDPAHIPDNMKILLKQGEDEFLDQIIDRKLETIFQQTIKDKSIGKLIIPVNMLYAERLKYKENSNVIQAVSNLIRLFKESKGMAERRQFAYEYGLQQKVNLTEEQEIEIEQILKGESKYSAGNYVRKYYPYVFDYFVESRQTRIEISDSFLFGIYEANITRKYKEGQLGKVLQFKKDSNIYQDTEEKAMQRQKIFYRILAQIILYKDKYNITNVFGIGKKEFVLYEGKNQTEEYFNDLMQDLQIGRKLYTGTYMFERCVPILMKTALGYMPNREDTLYQARLLLATLLNAYATQEIEPILPVISEDKLKVEDFAVDEQTSNCIRKMLASA